MRYDEAAVSVALLPLLDNFKFPSACETFGWCSSDVRASPPARSVLPVLKLCAQGLGEHDVSSAHFFAKMLIVLTARRGRGVRTVARRPALHEALSLYALPEGAQSSPRTAFLHLMGPDSGDDSASEISDAYTDETYEDLEADLFELHGVPAWQRVEEARARHAELEIELPALLAAVGGLGALEADVEMDPPSTASMGALSAASMNAPSTSHAITLSAASSQFEDGASGVLL